MVIPEDPIMLLSFLNMKLRDGDYESLAQLCDDLGVLEEEIVNKLDNAGFHYMDSIKQFR